jgi:hypothetical protein
MAGALAGSDIDDASDLVPPKEVKVVVKEGGLLNG